MRPTLQEQLDAFNALGELGPGGTADAVAVELADTLMRAALVGGPVERIGRLTALVGIMKSVTKIITAQRDLVAYSANAIWPHRRLAKLAGVNTSTMQGWVTAGSKVLEPQQVSRETMPANAKLNSTG